MEACLLYNIVCTLAIIVSIISEKACRWAYSSKVPGSGIEPRLWLRLPTIDTYVPRHNTLR